MVKSIFEVHLDNVVERVFAKDIYEAIAKAKSIGSNKNKICSSVEHYVDVYLTGKIKPINQIYKVTIDHNSLNMENAVYYIITRGVTYAAKFAMKIHLANCVLTDKEKKGLYVVGVEQDHTIYTS